MRFLEKRKSRRVSDAMALRVEPAVSAKGHAPIDTTPTHVVNISAGGLRFLHETKLSLTEPVLVTLCLGPQKKTVSLQAEVISSQDAKTPSGAKSFRAQVKFINIDKTAQNLLNQHITHVLDQTYKHCREYQYKATA